MEFIQAPANLLRPERILHRGGPAVCTRCLRLYFSRQESKADSSAKKTFRIDFQLECFHASFPKTPAPAKCSPQNTLLRNELMESESTSGESTLDPNLPVDSTTWSIPKLLSAKLPFFYGYLMIPIAVLVQIASSPGQTFAITAFTPTLETSLGLSSSKLALAYMLGTCLAAIPLSLVGPLSDRWGVRSAILLIATLLGLACFGMSQAQGFYSLLLGFLMLRFLGQGGMSLLSGQLVSMWFQESLGKVNAIMSLGGALAFAFLPMLLLESIELRGWRNSYVLLGACVMALIPVVWLLVSNRPEDLGQQADGLIKSHAGLKNPREATERNLTFSQAAGHRALWILIAGMTLWAAIGTGVVFYALQIFGSFGVPADQAKLLFVSFSSSMLAAQVLGGVFADFLPLHRLLAIGFALLAAGIATIPFTTGPFHMHLFACLFGAGQGIAISVSATMWVRYYGREHLGKIRGLAWCVTVAGSGSGPLILGIIKDQTGDFRVGLWLFAALLAPLPLLMLWATKPENSPDNQNLS